MDKEKNLNNEDNSNVGLGVDIVDIKHLKEVIERTPNFIERTFTPDEISYCQKSSRYNEHFATHFAAKEAVLKALGCGFDQGISPTDIEVCHNDSGRPYIELYGKAKGIAAEKKISSLPISLSFTNTEAVGFAIALTKEAAVQNKVLDKSKDPVAQLAKQFKEAKKLLDEKN